MQSEGEENDEENDEMEKGSCIWHGSDLFYWDNSGYRQH